MSLEYWFTLIVLLVMSLECWFTPSVVLVMLLSEGMMVWYIDWLTDSLWQTGGHEKVRSVVETVYKLWQSGVVKAHIDSTYALEDVSTYMHWFVLLIELFWKHHQLFYLVLVCTLGDLLLI